MNRILIGALTCQEMIQRRWSCMSTWFTVAKLHFPRPVFLEGGWDRTCFCGDYLRIACPDDYPSLPQKTRAFCRWALDCGGSWSHLFKCDDDTSICISRLGALDLSGVDYMGAEWKPGVDYGSGGAGYLLSRRAAQVVADGLVWPTGNEDELVGMLMRRAGIPLTISDRFIPWGSLEHRPAAGNDKITVHAVQRDVFEAVHKLDRAAGIA